MNCKIILGLLTGIWCSSVIGNNFDKNATYQTCFVPGEKCDEKIAEIIDHSQSSVYIQAYHLTNIKIINALIRAHSLGLNIEVILDKSALKEGQIFIQHGIPVFIDHNRAIAHNKVMIIDKEGVITGSFNFTESAQKRNVENFIYIKDPTLSELYYNNYEKRKSQSTN